MIFDRLKLAAIFNRGGAHAPVDESTQHWAPTLSGIYTSYRSLIVIYLGQYLWEILLDTNYTSVGLDLALFVIFGSFYIYILTNLLHGSQIGIAFAACGLAAVKTSLSNACRCRQHEATTHSKLYDVLGWAARGPITSQHRCGGWG